MLNLCRYDYHKDWKAPELSCIAPIKKPMCAVVGAARDCTCELTCATLAAGAVEKSVNHTDPTA